MMLAKRTLERRARLVATRFGWVLRKSLKGRGTARNHGEFRIVDYLSNTVIAGEHYDMTALDVINFIQSIEFKG